MSIWYSNAKRLGCIPEMLLLGQSIVWDTTVEGCILLCLGGMEDVDHRITSFSLVVLRYLRVALILGDFETPVSNSKCDNKNESSIKFQGLPLDHGTLAGQDRIGRDGGSVPSGRFSGA